MRGRWWGMGVMLFIVGFGFGLQRADASPPEPEPEGLEAKESGGDGLRDPVDICDDLEQATKAERARVTEDYKTKHANGARAYQGRYLCDEPVGRHRAWDEDGTLWFDRDFGEEG